MFAAFIRWLRGSRSLYHFISFVIYQRCLSIIIVFVFQPNRNPFQRRCHKSNQGRIGGPDPLMGGRAFPSSFNGLIWRRWCVFGLSWGHSTNRILSKCKGHKYDWKVRASEILITQIGREINAIISTRNRCPYHSKLGPLNVDVIIP